MAFKLGELVCFADTRNLGTGLCQYEPGIPMGSILIPRGKVLTKAEVLAIKTTLQALFTNDSKALRAYPIGPYDKVESTGADRVTETAESTGRTRTIRRSRIARRYSMWGSKTYFKAVFSFSGKHSSYDELVFDDKYQLLGVSRTDAAGKLGLGGYRLGDLYVGDYAGANGQNGGSFTIDVDYADSMEMNINETFVKLDFNPINDLTILADVVLTDETPSGGTANVAVVGTTYGGGNDLTAIFGTSLAKPGAWVVTDNATGNTVTPTTVAVVSGVGYSFTYTSATGKNYTHKLAAPSALAALPPPVLGLEGANSVSILIP